MLPNSASAFWNRFTADCNDAPWRATVATVAATDHRGAKVVAADSDRSWQDREGYLKGRAI
jgi:hypothetical protein